MGHKKGSQEAKEHAGRMRIELSKKLARQKKAEKIRARGEKKSAPPMDRVGKFGGALFEFGGSHKQSFDRLGKYGNDRFGRQEIGYA